MGYLTHFELKIQLDDSVIEEKQKLKELYQEAKSIENEEIRRITLSALKNKLQLFSISNIYHEVVKILGHDPFDDQSYWSNYRSDMIKVSKEIPYALFTVIGEGEERGDHWCEYFKNGKYQNANCRMVFDEFDPEKLK